MSKKKSLIVGFDHAMVRMRDMLLWLNMRTFYKLVMAKKIYLNPGSSKLLVLLPGRRVSMKYNILIKDKILSAGYSFLGYQFHHNILSEDHDATVRHFTSIRRDVRREIRAALSVGMV